MSKSRYIKCSASTAQLYMYKLLTTTLTIRKKKWKREKIRFHVRKRKKRKEKKIERGRGRRTQHYETVTTTKVADRKYSTMTQRWRSHINSVKLEARLPKIKSGKFVNVVGRSIFQLLEVRKTKSLSGTFDVSSIWFFLGHFLR